MSEYIGIFTYVIYGRTMIQGLRQYKPLYIIYFKDS